MNIPNNKGIGLIDQSTINGLDLKLSDKAYIALADLFTHSDWITPPNNPHIHTARKKVERAFPVHVRNPKTGVHYGAYTILTQRIDGREQHHLVVTANPTRILNGTNTRPVLLTDAEDERTFTFNTCLDLPFLSLEWLPKTDGSFFKWPKDERRQIKEGAYRVSQMQVAWYTGSMENRDEVLSVLRRRYGGILHVRDNPENGCHLAEMLGLKVTTFHNDVTTKNEGKKNEETTVHRNYNLSISARSGNNDTFQLTLYAKDKAPDYCEENESGSTEALSKRIRMDCTLRSRLLDDSMNKGNPATGASVKAFYAEKGKELGDDGFYRWLNARVVSDIRLDSVIKWHGSKLTRLIDSLLTYIKANEESNDPRSKTTAKLLKAWMDKEDTLNYSFNALFDSVVSDAELSNKRRRRDSIACYYAIRDQFDLDMNVPFSYLVHSGYSEVVHQTTRRERITYLTEEKVEFEVDAFPTVRRLKKRVDVLTRDVTQALTLQTVGGERLGKRLSSGVGMSITRMEANRIPLEACHLKQEIEAYVKSKG